MGGAAPRPTQHTHYGAVQRDPEKTRAKPASSGPPGACIARSRSPHALSGRALPDSADSLPEFPAQKKIDIKKQNRKRSGNGNEESGASERETESYRESERASDNLQLKRKLAHRNDVIRACTCEHDAVTLRVDRRLQGLDSAAHCVKCCSPQPPRTQIPSNSLALYLFLLLFPPLLSSPILYRGGSCSPRPSPSTAS